MTGITTPASHYLGEVRKRSLKSKPRLWITSFIVARARIVATLHAARLMREQPRAACSPFVGLPVLGPDGYVAVWLSRDADFKIHAPYQATVEGKVRGGKIVVLKVTLEKRKRDVVIAGQPIYDRF